MKETTFNIGNTTVKVRRPEVDEVAIRNLYEVLNEMFADNRECFYTTEETKKLRGK